MYTYDAQKRVTMIQRYPTGKNNPEGSCQGAIYTYDTNPLNATFSQNAMGRLTTAQYGSCAAGHNFRAADMYSYHPAGAVTAKQMRVVKCVTDEDGNYACPVAPLEVDYTYDGMGQVASYAGLVYGTDGMGRHVSLGADLGCGLTEPVLQNGQYDYAGRLTSLQYAYALGSGSWVDCGSNSYYVPAITSQTESRTYNSGTGRLTSIAWGSVSAPGYSFGGGSVQYVYPATQNNGQITQMVDSLSGETVTYQYDALKRLVSACSSLNNCTTAPTTFQYDGFGNLTSKTLAGVTSAIPVNAGTNQLSNAFYDANGNMTSGAGVTLAYDAGNRVQSASPASGGTEYYGYSAENKRVWRLKADGVTEEWTLYGARGEKIGVYQWGGLQEHFDGQGNWTGDTASFSPLRTSVWFDGRLVRENGTYVMGDRLGTSRAGGARFLPYGEETSSTANDRTKFGSYNRDGLTGLDYADQRYYASSYGRFNSPDPKQSSAMPKVPKSWNRYSYVGGDPIRFLDPHGTEQQCGDGWIDDPSLEGPCCDGENPDPACYVGSGGGGGGGGGSGGGNGGNGFADDPAVSGVNGILTNNLKCDQLLFGQNATTQGSTDRFAQIQVLPSSQLPNGAPPLGTATVTGTQAQWGSNEPWAEMNGGNIYLNDLYFPNDTAANISTPWGATLSAVAVFNHDHNTSLTGLQMEETVILHELWHIKGSDSEVHGPNALATLISTCIN